MLRQDLFDRSGLVDLVFVNDTFRCDISRRRDRISTAEVRICRGSGHFENELAADQLEAADRSERV